ncbi:MAG: Sugar-phosphate nucleotidyltransferase [Acetothermia bacterium 64_32]|nr:MAG: Sugar-phosphate nucleotidyltransferase [Acetothermia bacterium 64_32]
MSVKTVILAGGYARRLWPITLDRPKPLLPVAGKPILDYLMERYPFPEPPILSTNRRFAADFSAWAKERGYSIQLAVEDTAAEEEKLGSVGALARLVEVLDLKDDLLVIGGDNLFSFELGELVASFHGEVLVALYELGDPQVARRRYGVAVVEGDLVVGFQEKPEDPRSSLASTACYVFPRRVLPLFRDFLNQAPAGQDAPGYFLSWLLSRERIRAFVFREGWFDIGGREAYIAANLHFNGGKSWIHPEAEVRGSRIERSVVLGPSLIENSRLSGCVVDEGAELSGVELEDTLIGRGSRLRAAD